MTRKIAFIDFISQQTNKLIHLDIKSALVERNGKQNVLEIHFE